MVLFRAEVKLGDAEAKGALGAFYNLYFKKY